MNIENLRMPGGSCNLGLRLRIPDSELKRVCCSPPALMATQLLGALLETTLRAEGVTVSNIGLGGEFHQAVGLLSVTDPAEAVPIVQSVLKRVGLVEPFVELFIYDPNELFWRSLSPGAHEPFDLDRVEAAANLGMRYFESALGADMLIAACKLSTSDSGTSAPTEGAPGDPS